MHKTFEEEQTHNTIMEAVDNLCKEHNLGFNDLLDVLSAEMKIQSEKEPHGVVSICLDSCAGFLRDAAMSFYVSTK